MAAKQDTVCISIWLCSIRKKLGQYAEVFKEEAYETTADVALMTAGNIVDILTKLDGEGIKPGSVSMGLARSRPGNSRVSAAVILVAASTAAAAAAAAAAGAATPANVLRPSISFSLLLL